ncbi:hypothetical protein NDU88_002254 [Pleurodeles waltl]|uniref:Uncharacterized protein n=1 Tax=Pleurodeles waltl TaxID=8319 RepID=A0AAV7Q6C9_PLEWA|nr:hypothetical protein NDU88_002254 [Pleurodeles waltl]
MTPTAWRFVAAGGAQSRTHLSCRPVRDGKQARGLQRWVRCLLRGSSELNLSNAVGETRVSGAGKKARSSDYTAAWRTH